MIPKVNSSAPTSNYVLKAGNKKVVLESIEVPIILENNAFVKTEGYLALKFKNNMYPVKVWFNIPNFSKLVTDDFDSSLEKMAKRIEMVKNMVYGRVYRILSVYITDNNVLSTKTKALTELCYSSSCREQIDEYREGAYTFNVEGENQYFVDKNLLAECDNDLELLAEKVQYFLDYFMYCVFSSLEQELNNYNRETVGFTFVAWKKSATKNKYYLNPIQRQESLILPYKLDNGKPVYGYPSFDSQFIFQGEPIQTENENGSILGLYSDANDYQKQYALMMEEGVDVETSAETLEEQAEAEVVESVGAENVPNNDLPF